MSYLINLEGFEGQKLEAKFGFWTGPKLLVNDLPPQKGMKRGEMLLLRNDGRQVTASWRPQLIGLDVPQLLVDGKLINLAQPLKWYQWLWSALPILLVFLGGLLGALTGVIAFTINTSLFRSRLSEIMKYVVTGLISITAFGVYLVLGTIFAVLLNG